MPKGSARVEADESKKTAWGEDKLRSTHRERPFQSLPTNHGLGDDNKTNKPFGNNTDSLDGVAANRGGESFR